MTAAALIMYSVCASFVRTPDATLKTIALGSPSESWYLNLEGAAVQQSFSTNPDPRRTAHGSPLDDLSGQPAAYAPGV